MGNSTAIKTVGSSPPPRYASGTRPVARAHKLVSARLPGEYKWDEFDPACAELLHTLPDEDVIEIKEAEEVIVLTPAPLHPEMDIGALLKSEFALTNEYKTVQRIINKWMYDSLTERARAQLCSARQTLRQIRRERARGHVSLDKLVYCLSVVVRARAQARAFRNYRDTKLKM